jgi:transcriptional regulator of acetoin/glycerol metabolism
MSEQEIKFPTFAEMKKDYILRALDKTCGNVLAASYLMGVSKTTAYVWAEQAGIARRRYGKRK